jgi:hypothetical protein
MLALVKYAGISTQIILAEFALMKREIRVLAVLLKKLVTCGLWRDLEYIRDNITLWEGSYLLWME